MESLEVARRTKLEQITALGIDPWGSRFDGRTMIGDIRHMQVPEDPMAGPPLKAAGRVMTYRKMGKLRFIDLADRTGRIQLMIGQKQVDETSWKLVDLIDLGDLIGVTGRLGKTKVGELTLFVEQLHYQGKSLLPHPDKWSGIEDQEFALRHRYLDYIYTPELRSKAEKRLKIMNGIRQFLEAEGYFEVETPVLHNIAGGAAAKPFETHHNALDIPLFLRIALELPLKKLLVAGFDKVYEMSRVFRNEGISPKHNPEFTMMELYQAYGNYESMMDLTERLVVKLVESTTSTPGEYVLPYAERAIDFKPPFQRQKYGDLFLTHVGVDMRDATAVNDAARKRGIDTTGKDHAVLIHLLFEIVVEPALAQIYQPVFVYDYPAALCPLTKRKWHDPFIAERFECYVLGMEIANAYTELNDPETQEATFRSQLSGLKEEDSMAKLDMDFVTALRYGMPPAGGLGIGIDRLCMLLTNSQTIRDVILFPLLRPGK
ncbi:MAG: lysine--tRNA ligase [Planctomycetia bacterium]|nr:lysine--tRNA ligase [Planctomycetia bacterium]